MAPNALAKFAYAAGATRSPYLRLLANPATWNRFFTTSSGWMMSRATVPAPKPHAALVAGSILRSPASSIFFFLSPPPFRDSTISPSSP